MNPQQAGPMRPAPEAEKEQRLREFRASISDNIAKTASVALGLLIIGLGAIWVYFPEHKQILMYDGILGIGFLGCIVYPIIRQHEQRFIASFVFILGIFVLVLMTPIFLPHTLPASAIGYIFIIFIGSFQLNSRVSLWLIILCVSGLAINIFLVESGVGLFPELDMNLRLASTLMVCLATFPITGILVRRAILMQADLFRQTEIANFEIEHRIQEGTKELQEAKAHIEAMFNSIHNPIALINSDGNVTSCNPAFFREFGYEHDECSQVSVFNIIEDIVSIKQIIQNAANSEIPHRLQAIARRRDGSNFDAEVTIAPVIDGQEIKGNLICSIYDISYYKEIERIKEDFIDMVSHELRTPITSLVLNTNSLLKYNNRLSEEQKMQKFNRLQTQSKILAELVDGILQISRLGQRKSEHELQVIEVNQLVTAVANEFQKPLAEKNQEFILEISEKPLLLNYVEYELSSIWYNLISNAIKYTPVGGMIWARTAKLTVADGLINICGDIKSLDLSEPNLFPRGEYIIGQVEDNGAGIDPDHIEHIFKRFNRGWAASSAIPGTGLGLALVSETLAYCGGGIQVSSKKGAGSIFTFWIPKGVTGDG